jgi:hypothetical protein
LKANIGQSLDLDAYEIGPSRSQMHTGKSENGKKTKEVASKNIAATNIKPKRCGGPWLDSWGEFLKERSMAVSSMTKESTIMTAISQVIGHPASMRQGLLGLRGVCSVNSSSLEKDTEP